MELLLVLKAAFVLSFSGKNDVCLMDLCLGLFTCDWLRPDIHTQPTAAAHIYFTSLQRQASQLCRDSMLCDKACTRDHNQSTRGEAQTEGGVGGGLECESRGEYKEGVQRGTTDDDLVSVCFW